MKIRELIEMLETYDGDDEIVLEYDHDDTYYRGAVEQNFTINSTIMSGDREWVEKVDAKGRKRGRWKKNPDVRVWTFGL
jgi:hypothetical protein